MRLRIGRHFLLPIYTKYSIQLTSSNVYFRARYFELTMSLIIHDNAIV